MSNHPLKPDSAPPRPIIFTDLDGTLLDADYSFHAADEALRRAASMDIPLVPFSSKTREEIEHIRAELENAHPFISENGGGIYIPAGYFPFPTGAERTNGYLAIALGLPYKDVREALSAARTGLNARVIGFGDLSSEEISGLTGLSLTEAGLSKKRDFDEPFIFDGDRASEELLLARLRDRGVACVKGKFFHASGAHDKGRAVGLLKGFYERLHGRIITICAGNGRSDESALRQADYAVLVEKDGGGYEEMDIPGIVRAAGAGPSGWNRAMLGILDSIEASRSGYRC